MPAWPCMLPFLHQPGAVQPAASVSGAEEGTASGFRIYWEFFGRFTFVWPERWTRNCRSLQNFFFTGLFISFGNYNFGCQKMRYVALT